MYSRSVDDAAKEFTVRRRVLTHWKWPIQRGTMWLLVGPDTRQAEAAAKLFKSSSFGTLFHTTTKIHSVIQSLF